ncbi:L-ascorbate metabolism protein UlaG (beta-lactamase superfamily) [Priestia taiwanensis]|uniref:Membrane protein n=2 Tax=Priestia taiwanensis TaxID=1347902 RepID=A0A917AM37_9BACI|nr:L-ascorbate metabolism protein UlaG (beta-lactamase superfamily) [Priestia taiwanensis]GGE59315.1 membrane protein [Priestia taiwanensis]
MRYKNIDNHVTNKKSIGDMYRWRKERSKKKKDVSYNVPQSEEKQIAYLQSNKKDTTITWIGHSTFLVQLDGCTILTDPVWAYRMGFDKRLTNPGLAISDLPEIDVVVISHGHYDHLDFPTLKKLPHGITYFVPVGLKKLFNKKGFTNVEEFTWWEEQTYRGVTFSFVPAQHWTRRTMLDMNTSHWGGWMFQGTETIYFGGDSGYFHGFKEIGERFDIDIALMPIGAYEPEWFMRDSHMAPEEAVQAYLDIQAKHFIPMHYGAFRLADDTTAEALERLHEAWEKYELPKEQLTCLSLGETYK